MVKPLHEGSSKGIFERSVVENIVELKTQLEEVIEKYKQPALVESFLSGREFTVGIIGNGEAAEVLPVIELLFDHLPKDSKKIYSYEAKWLWDDPNNPVEVFKCPAPLTDALKKEIESIAKRAYLALRCRDWSRVDVRLDAAGKPHIIEINPLPGILPNPDEHSCMPLAARVAGMDFAALINRVLDEALKRYGMLNATLTAKHQANQTA
jgi:D-alanine-D-alanine ligase